LTRNSPDFARNGLPTGTRLGEKLWRVAVIQGHHNPFRDELLALNEAQLDFILEMYAQDHPKEFSFTRKDSKSPQSEISAAWTRVLRGNALTEYIMPMLNTKAIEWRRRLASSRPRLGVIKGPPADAQSNDLHKAK
jgi:hypothetical protein